MSSQSFNAKTTAEQAAQAFKDQIQGENVLITGCSPGGLGEETARVLGVNGAGLLVCTGRDQSKVEQVFKTIRSETPSANLRFLSLDISSLESVKAAAQKVLGYSESLDVLIANAGVMALPESKTEEENPGYIQGTEGQIYDKWNAYGQSKTSNMLYALSLSKKLKSKGIKAFSLHPGVLQSPLWRNLSAADLKHSGVLTEDGKETGKFVDVDGKLSDLKTVQEGAATYVVTAFSPLISAQAGSYIVDCQVSNESASPCTRDEVKADKLWKLSEELVGQKFDF